MVIPLLLPCLPSNKIWTHTKSALKTISGPKQKARSKRRHESITPAYEPATRQKESAHRIHQELDGRVAEKRAEVKARD